jgi:hypothetical protein
MFLPVGTSDNHVQACRSDGRLCHRLRNRNRTHPDQHRFLLRRNAAWLPCSLGDGEIISRCQPIFNHKHLHQVKTLRHAQGFYLAGRSGGCLELVYIQGMKKPRRAPSGLVVYLSGAETVLLPSQEACSILAHQALVPTLQLCTPKSLPPTEGRNGGVRRNSLLGEVFRTSFVRLDLLAGLVE